MSSQPNLGVVSPREHRDNEKARMTAALTIQTLNEQQALQEHTIQADSGNCEVWLKPLPGASAIHVLLRTGESPLRAEIEVDSEEAIPVQVQWDDKRVLDITSGSRRITTLPPDERYAPPPFVLSVRDSKKLDLFFLIDGTAKTLLVPEPPAESEAPQGPPPLPQLVPLLGKDNSQTWNQLAQKLMQFANRLAKLYPDLRTGVMAFGDHNMDFIAGAADLTCRYLFYPQELSERKLQKYIPEQLKQQLLQLPTTSGGDFVDALSEALQQCGFAGWRNNARKILVICGDSPGYSMLKPAPLGADIHVRGIDLDQECTHLCSQYAVEIVSIYSGVPATIADNPYGIAEPKEYLDHSRSQYLRLASLPNFFWTDASFEPRKAVEMLQTAPATIGRGACYGSTNEEMVKQQPRTPASKQATAQSAD